MCFANRGARNAAICQTRASHSCPALLVCVGGTFSVLGLGSGFTDFVGARFYLSVGLFLLFLLSLRKQWEAWLERFTDKFAVWQQQTLDLFDDKYLGLFVVLSAAISLFFELALIRWQGSLFPVFSFYKNFTLLACFVGLGLGYARSESRSGVLVYCLYLLSFQLLFFLLLRYLGDDVALLLEAVPVLEQAHMGLADWSQFKLGEQRFVSIFAVYIFLGLSFVLTVLIMFPIGQLCGHFVDRGPRLQAYGRNLLGSLLGVVLFFAISYFWTPPAVWFAVVVFALMFFQTANPWGRVVVMASAFLVMVLSVWPVQPMVQKLYSPYQSIERVTDKDTGLVRILAAGYYHQRVHHFAVPAQAGLSDDERAILNYYDLPYQFLDSPEKVAIVGAGSGNDVAAALRADAGKIDAIEIDPVIVELGRVGHPEGPYDGANVNVIINDARSFFRTTKERYDLIVYGVLDSHAQLSHGSNVRLDSFVYTVEGIRESWRILKDGGVMSLSFAINTPAQVHRIFEMLRVASEGREPMIVATGYDSGSTFTYLMRKGAGAAFDKERIRAAGFDIRTDEFRGTPEEVDIPTDDWPFFYMLKRVYPLSYVLTLLFLMGLTVALSRRLIVGTSFSGGLLTFFFLGAGFMLVETKAITEFGLLFGNTWQVVGVIISAILLMAYSANVLVEKLRPERPWWAYAMLFTVIVLGYLVTGERFDFDYQLQRVLALILLTVPIFFSGVIFSTQLNASTYRVSQIVAYNIMGAMFGGLLEYNSMYFGFSFLYLLAIALYGLAWWFSWSKRAQAQEALPDTGLSD